MAAFFVSSPNVRKTFPSAVIVTSIDLSGAALLETELGGVTASTSGGFCLVARMKKVRSKKATSHIAVISIFVLLRGILTFGIHSDF